MLMKNNNNYKTFRVNLNNPFHTSYPNIYNFIDVLNDIQPETCIQL